MSRRSYKSESIKYVINLLPQFVYDNWDFQRMELINASYDRSHYTGEQIIPDGNIIVMFPNGNYSETYVYPASNFYPYLNVGHTYYIRYMVRKEYIANANKKVIDTNNNGIGFDIYWPVMENGLVRDFNKSNNGLWFKYTNIITLTSSQWTQPVSDGAYPIRLDCNNQRKYIKWCCFADFMLINLTKCYTQKGLQIPTLNELNSKPYFYGYINMDSWHY